MPDPVIDIQSELDFLLLLDNKLTLLANKISIIGPVQDMIAMVKARIATLQQMRGA
jgi:hypothetical protein